MVVNMSNDEPLKRRPQQVKVLHITERLVGGITTYIEELVLEQIKIYGSDNVHILCPAEHVNHFSPALLKLATVTSFERKKRGLLAVVRMVKKLHKLQRDWRPDIVHCHSTFAGVVGRLPWLLPSVRIIYTPNSWSFSMRTHWLIIEVYALIERLLAGRTDALLAVSKSEAASAEKHRIKPRMVRVIHTGLRPGRGDVVKARSDRSGRVGEPPVQIIMVGRFEPQKRHDELVKALTPLAGMNWMLSLVGDGFTRQAIDNLVASLGLKDRVNFLGQRRDVLQLLQQSDIFVMTSDYEGFPLSILEAMKVGLPVVVNDVDGNSEAVISGQTGYLVASGDAKSLTQSLKSLIESPELRAKFGSSGRDKFEREFTAQKMIDQMSRLYEELLASPTAPDLRA